MANQSVNFLKVVDNPEEMYKEKFNNLKSGTFFTVQIGTTRNNRLFLVTDDSIGKTLNGDLCKSVVELSDELNKEIIINGPCDGSDPDSLTEKIKEFKYDSYCYDDKDCINIIETGSKDEYVQEKLRWKRLKEMWKWWRENRTLSEYYGDKYTLLYYENDEMKHITNNVKQFLLDIVSSKKLKDHRYLFLHGLEDL